MPDERPGGLVAGIPLGPGTPARRPTPEPKPAPRPTQVPDHVAQPDKPVPLDAAPVDPDDRLPLGFAKISVHPALDDRGREVFWLKGLSSDPQTRLDSEHPWLPPADLALHRLRKGGKAPPPSEILLGLAEWSLGQDDLVCWINALRARYGPDLQLVIWDDTDYDIPWELLNLGARDGGGLVSEILGALVTVVRWSSSLHCGPASPLGVPASCAGHVLGYYAHGMTRDADAFDGFEHEPHIGSIETFLAELTRPDLGAGLVYMGCHAEHGSKLNEVTLAELTWSEYYWSAMPSLSGGSTLVYLNACDSARLVDNHGRGDNALRGFPELFLRKGAGACIATSGKVGDDVAHELVRELVGRVCADPELPVARALREFRAGALARLPDTLPRARNGLAQRRILLFLYSFMFLFFGHPFTTLQLSERTPEVPA
ncbi:CHAT domain-containing protein [Streptomyces sp. NBC_00124]|uniref:CHAT domain-containing protein n=1 Tax=Streptomyces sp. NBC_00124 TaxID=2975662 RepID=UPI002258A8D8|nr:CHAT domain-containing protein [Streptomyces sp. NBC_00124]MCX5360047.1 CHAT domain-containing protein [Streptomyces sp. NBC_00124]